MERPKGLKSGLKNVVLELIVSSHLMISKFWYEFDRLCVRLVRVLVYSRNPKIVNSH